VASASRTIGSFVGRLLRGGDLLGADLESGDQIAASRERIVRRPDRRDRRATLVLGALFLAAAGALAAILPPERPFPWALAAAVAAAYIVVSRVEFEIGPATVVPTQIVFVPMVFLLPLRTVPFVAAACYVLGAVVDRIRGEAHLERCLLGLTSAWFSLGPVLVLGLAGVDKPAWSDWPLYVAALGAQFLFDFLASAGRGLLAFGERPTAQILSLASAALLDVALAPVGLVAAVVSASGHGFAFALCLPVVGLMAVFARERRIRIDHALELGQAYRGTAMLLGDVVEADDAYTGAHSRDVVSLTLAVCARAGITGRDARTAEFVALLHDVGKIRIPTEVIRKPGPLSPDEWALMKTHTIEGERMLSGVGGILGEVGAIVRSCHERFDGSGYPDGLAADDIPQIARIVACCDAFSAMTTDRSYRKALPVPAALRELRANSGTQFDPFVVDLLVDVVEQDVERPALLRRREQLVRDEQTRVVVADRVDAA